VFDPAAERAAIAFNDAINRCDLDRLRALMTDDHEFIDTARNVVAGREAALAAWRGFFAAFPDYRNEWESVTAAAGAVTAVGRSSCPSEAALDGPAIWIARIAGDGRVSQWRVHEDTPENRRQLGIERGDGR
jgi:ketosteroid isomerase-like protein